MNVGLVLLSKGVGGCHDFNIPQSPWVCLPLHLNFPPPLYFFLRFTYMYAKIFGFGPHFLGKKDSSSPPTMNLRFVLYSIIQ